MDNKNIIFNHTFEQYNKKYRNRKHRLLKLTKKEVEDFDKNNSTYKKEHLLKDRKWWLIKDAYYEIPKFPRLTWYRNLHIAAQVGIAALGVGVIATSVAVPLAVMNMNNINYIEYEMKYDNKDYCTETIDFKKDCYYKIKCDITKDSVNYYYLKDPDKPDDWISFKGCFDINSFEVKHNNNTIKTYWEDYDGVEKDCLDFSDGYVAESGEVTLTFKCVSSCSLSVWLDYYSDI